MFKDKRFLAGLGVGIIAGGLLLQVMIVGEGGTDNKSDERLYTEQEVQQLVEKAKLDKEAAEASGEQAKVDNTTNAGDSGKKPSEPAEVTPTKNRRTLPLTRLLILKRLQLLSSPNKGQPIPLRSRQYKKRRNRLLFG